MTNQLQKKKDPRGRKPLDPTIVKKRVNIAMRDDIKSLAAEIGGGNVSAGIEKALKAYDKNHY